MSNPPPEAEIKEELALKKSFQILTIVSGVLILLIVLWFYGFEERFGPARSQSAFQWLKDAWNAETDYEHGLMFPFIILGLIVHQFKNLKAAAAKGSNWGLLSVLIGVLFFIISYRTYQPRVAAGALPFILWGSCYYLWGWKLARILLFPLFFFWLAVPLPSFQQATTHLQLLATSLSHFGAGLFGVETEVVGTTILPTKGDWQPLDIATGCSGIRSLMALMMISATWAYVAKIKMWQRVVLFSSALPLAILGNALRVTSIFVIAEYGDPEWASTTWHDWSGLLLFYPFSLFLLLILHSLFEGGLPWRRNSKRKLRRASVLKTESQEEFQPRS